MGSEMDGHLRAMSRRWIAGRPRAVQNAVPPGMQSVRPDFAALRMFVAPTLTSTSPAADICDRAFVGRESVSVVHPLASYPMVPPVTETRLHLEAIHRQFLAPFLARSLTELT